MFRAPQWNCSVIAPQVWASTALCRQQKKAFAKYIKMLLVSSAVVGGIHTVLCTTVWFCLQQTTWIRPRYKRRIRNSEEKQTKRANRYSRIPPAQGGKKTHIRVHHEDGLQSVSVVGCRTTQFSPHPSALSSPLHQQIVQTLNFTLQCTPVRSRVLTRRIFLLLLVVCVLVLVWLRYLYLISFHRSLAADEHRQLYSFHGQFATERTRRHIMVR